MTKHKVTDHKLLKYRVGTRVTEAKYRELQGLVAQAKGMNLAGVFREILYNRPIKVYTHDDSIDLQMEELALIRGELKPIGININQVTKLFNTYPDLKRKLFYGRSVIEQFMTTEAKVDRLTAIISQMGKKWLQG